MLQAIDSQMVMIYATICGYSIFMTNNAFKTQLFQIGFRPGLILGKNEQSQATHRVLEGKNDQILLLFHFWLF